MSSCRLQQVETIGMPRGASNSAGFVSRVSCLLRQLGAYLTQLALSVLLLIRVAYCTRPVHFDSGQYLCSTPVWHLNCCLLITPQLNCGAGLKLFCPPTAACATAKCFADSISAYMAAPVVAICHASPAARGTRGWIRSC